MEDLFYDLFDEDFYDVEDFDDLKYEVNDNFSLENELSVNEYWRIREYLREEDE